MKKAMELSILCDCEVTLTINNQGDIARYSSHDKEKFTTSTQQHIENCSSLNNEDYKTLFKEQEKISIKETPKNIPAIIPSSISIVYYTLQLNQNSQNPLNSNQAPLFFIPGDSTHHPISLPASATGVVVPTPTTTAISGGISMTPAERTEDVPTALHIDDSTGSPAVAASFPPEPKSQGSIPEDVLNSSAVLKPVEKIGEELFITIPNRTAPIVFPSSKDDHHSPPTPLITPSGIFTPNGESFPPLITPFSALGTPTTPTFFNNPNF